MYFSVRILLSRFPRESIESKKTWSMNQSIFIKIKLLINIIEVIYSQESPNMVEVFRDFDWELDRFVEYRLPIKKPLY